MRLMTFLVDTVVIKTGGKMREIKLNKVSTTEPINISDVSEHSPVFAKRDGKFLGMIVDEGKGWILRIGGSGGSYGYCKTFNECVVRGIRDYGYTFHVEME